MIINILVDNRSLSKDFRCEHGLSLHIETNKHNILFDTGASDLFKENALKMDVDLSKVDVAVISHGQYDHGGGIKVFLETNKIAPIYIEKSAFGDFFSRKPGGGKNYIGLNKALLPNDRFVFTDRRLVIDEELELFSEVKGENMKPSGNIDLFMKREDLMVGDDFSHEQSLIIREKDHTVLIAGCAHMGIINILEHYKSIYDSLPSHVIGGFHLYNRAADSYEDPDTVEKIGAYLSKTGAMFYTCHCTGLKAYEELKRVMHDRINYLATGSQIII